LNREIKREDILILAFSVVLFSLVGQGLSIKPLLSLLGGNKKEEGHKDYEELIARGHRFETAIAEINKVKKNLFITEAVSKEIVNQHVQKLAQLQRETELLLLKYPDLKEKQQAVLLKHSLYAQHDAIEELLKEDIISNEVADQEHDLITNELVNLEDSH
jgi:monovalent cation:H+ antiporter, CPA1 family